MEFNYWEEYAGQDITGFTHVGVEGHTEPIASLEEQVKELQRVYGRDAGIRIYKDEAVSPM